MQARASYHAWLDPLRAFAALSVLLYHLIALAALPMPTWYPPAWFRLGFLGVDLFFAISGAVILQSLAQLHERDPAHWRARFAWRRLARLLPLYLVSGAVFLLLVRPELMQRDDALQLVLAHLLFVQNLFFSTHGAINGPSWSLGVEMQFYLVMLLLGPILLRLRWSSLLLVGVVTGVGWRTATWWWARELAPGDEHRVFIVATQLPGVFDEFVAGMLAWRWSRAQRERGVATHPARAWRLGVAALFAWTLAILWMYQHLDDYWRHPASVIGIRCALALAAGLTVAAVMAIPAPRAGAAALRAGGDLSYGLYLWHMGLLLLLQQAFPALAPIPFALLVIAATVLVSALSWIGLERPSLRLARAREPGARDEQAGRRRPAPGDPARPTGAGAASQD
jgi:peptidoglycan/LPS O-acetylase OafA/YrhL